MNYQQQPSSQPIPGGYPPNPAQMNQMMPGTVQPQGQVMGGQSGMPMAGQQGMPSGQMMPPAPPLPTAPISPVSVASGRVHHQLGMGPSQGSYPQQQQQSQGPYQQTLSQGPYSHPQQSNQPQQSYQQPPIPQQSYQQPTPPMPPHAQGQSSPQYPPPQGMMAAPGQYPANPNYPQAMQQGMPPMQQGMPQMQQGMSPMQQGMQNSGSKINPAAIPSMVAWREADQQRHGEQQQPWCSSSLGEAMPPLPLTPATLLDDGQALPHLARLTSYQVPATEELSQSSRLPLAMLLQPFAQRDNLEVPVVCPQEGPMRCLRCRAYVSAWVQWLRGGRAWQCPICGMSNECPAEYQASLDVAGRRADLASRPELRCGTVDYDVTHLPDYCTRKPQPARLLVMLEISRAAVQSGAFLAQCRLLAGLLQQPETLPYGRIGLLLFDRAMHFVDLRGGLEPQLLTVSDLSEPFVPLHDGLFWDPRSAAGPLALQLLERLPGLYAETRQVDSCLGAALLVAKEALRGSGGRVLACCAMAPTLGPGVPAAGGKNRDLTGPQLPVDRVNPLLSPLGDWHTGLGKDLAYLGISVDLLCCPPTSLDVATLGELPTLTGGHLWYYPRYALETEMARTVHQSLMRPWVYDCVLRVRCGSGLSVKEYLGTGASPNETDWHLAAVDPTQALTVSFAYEGSRLSEGERMPFQAAILHTTPQGRRRIRVINLSLPVTTNLLNVFRVADLDALLGWQVRHALRQLPDASLAYLAGEIMGRGCQILAAYRKHCAQNMPGGQLVLPESLKLLPLSLLAILKQTGLAIGQSSPAGGGQSQQNLPSSASASAWSAESRVVALRRLAWLGMEELTLQLYPRLIPLHTLAEIHDGRLSQEMIGREGVHLLCDGQRLLLQFGVGVEPAFLQALLGVTQLSQVDPALTTLPALNTPASQRTRYIIDALRRQCRWTHLPLTLVRQGLDPTELQWFSLLVEDGQTTGSIGSTYSDFLVRIHAQIGQEMNAQPSLTERAALLGSILH